MKFSVFFLSFFISSLSLISQVGVPTRTVLHTLSKNEVLHSGEYYTFQSANKNGYSCVINDTIRSKETLIFNGKIIHSFDFVWRNIFEIDLSKVNGYVFKYWESEKCFVNFRDQIMGPFEEATNEIYEIYSNENYKIPTNYNFFYKLGGSWYSFYEGKAQMLEIDKNDKDDVENAWPTYGSTGDKGKWYLSSIDGEDYTDKIRYDELVRVTKNDVIVAYICVINGNKYVVLNGVLSEPLDNVSEYSIQLNGRNYMYNYIKNKKKYVNVNGKSLEIDCDDNPYGEILSNGTYYFSYTNKNKQFVNINGKVFGPYNGMNYSTQLHENGKFAFIFEKDNLFYLNNNGSISKGYPYIFDLETQPDGFFKYNFSMEDGWVYENANGQIKKTQDRKIGYGKGAFLPSVDKYVIQSKNKSHTLSIDLAYDYVVIDGKSFGKAPAIKAWYDETKNCFIWNSWEGKELVIYEFKLD